MAFEDSTRSWLDRRFPLSWAVLLVVLLQAVFGGAAHADSIDLDANSAIIEHLQSTLPRFGLGNLHIGGGAALSLAMSARHGTDPGWKDIDIRAFPRRGLDAKLMERLAAELTRDGSNELLAPGVIEFIVHHRGKDLEGLHSQGFGLRMQTRAGLRFDIAVLRNRDEIARSGYNSAESLVIPLRGGDDLRKVLTRLETGTAEDVVARGDLVEVHGHALDVLRGKVQLTNRHLLAVEPELAALRYLRGAEKLARYGVHAVDGKRDIDYLKQNLRGVIARAPEVKDPSYAPRVQEQAQALLETGGPAMHRQAKEMGLDLTALVRGTIARSPAVKITAAKHR